MNNRVLQSGTITPSNIASWTTDGVVQDAGVSVNTLLGAPPANIVTSTEANTVLYEVSTRAMGAVADGGSHPLSTRYASLASAQAVYSFATSLTQEIDYCAVQKAFYEAFGYPGSEHAGAVNLNRPVHIDYGNYQFGNDYVKTVNLHSGLIYGDGKLVTILNGTGLFVIQTNGCWYTTWQYFQISFNTNAGTAAFDLDGNILHNGSTNGVQGCSFRDMLITTSGSTYCLAVCRIGGNFGQGSECEFSNVHLSGASVACYYQNGFNAVDNKFVGGDTQVFSKYGHQHVNGSCHYYGRSFEAGSGYAQIANGGADLSFAGGAFQGNSIYGCRSESPIFLNSQNGVVQDVRSCVGTGGTISAWQAGHSYNNGDAVQVSGSSFPDNEGRVFVVTTPGTSGGVQPNWPWQASGGNPSTVTDGGVTWTQVPFDYIFVKQGSVELATCSASAGRIDFPTFKSNAISITPTVHTANYTISAYDDIVLMDATGGNLTVSIPGLQVNAGQDVLALQRRLVVKKVDTSANTVTVQTVNGEWGFQDVFEGGGTTDVIAGGSRGWREYSYGPKSGGGVPPVWYKIGNG